jgi:hypothetical protein
MVLVLLMRWAIVRRGQPFPLRRTLFPIIVVRVDLVVDKLVVAITIATAPRLVMTWLRQWIAGG